MAAFTAASSNPYACKSARISTLAVEAGAPFFSQARLRAANGPTRTAGAGLAVAVAVVVMVVVVVVVVMVVVVAAAAAARCERVRLAGGGELSVGVASCALRLRVVRSCVAFDILRMRNVLGLRLVRGQRFTKP